MGPDKPRALRTRNGDLVANTILNKMRIGFDSGCDFTGTELIEEANVLAQGGFEILFSDALASCLCRNNPPVGIVVNELQL